MTLDTRRYWDANAGAFGFSHPIDLSWFTGLPKGARILDYGCGYGRTLAELRAAGWRNSVGVDFSREMIARGRRENPEIDLRHIDRLPLDERGGAYDAAILFAVLTTIEADEAQDILMAELARLLRCGGLIYVSDYRLQTDPRHLERYRLGLARHGVYGVWTREDGGVFRHHTPERFAALMARFELLARRDVETRTLSGAVATATQVLGRRR